MALPAFAQRYKKRVSSLVQKLSKTNTTPEAIATGFAIGSFIAVLPLFGGGALLVLLIILLDRNLNKVALVGAIAVWNPITLIPVYSLSYAIGDAIFRDSLAAKISNLFLARLIQHSGKFVMGNLIVAVLVSFISYIAMRQLVVYYRTRIKK